MEGVIFMVVMFAFFLLLFTDDYWGPGVRNILNSTAHRIRYGQENVQVSAADEYDENRGGGRKWSWLRWVLAIIVAVPGAIYFTLKVYEELS